MPLITTDKFIDRAILQAIVAIIAAIVTVKTTVTFLVVYHCFVVFPAVLNLYQVSVGNCHKPISYQNQPRKLLTPVKVSQEKIAVADCVLALYYCQSLGRPIRLSVLA